MDEIRNNTCEVIEINQEVINELQILKGLYEEEKERIFNEIIKEYKLEKYLNKSSKNKE